MSAIVDTKLIVHFVVVT